MRQCKKCSGIFPQRKMIKLIRDSDDLEFDVLMYDLCKYCAQEILYLNEPMLFEGYLISTERLMKG